HIRDMSGMRAPPSLTPTGVSHKPVPGAGTGPPTARYGGRRRDQDVAPSLRPHVPCITGLPALHSPEQSLNPAEIEHLQGRILALEVENARLKPSVATGPTLRREAETALADSEERYRTLFNSVDEGFCIIEFFDGPHGPLSDHVHVEADAAYE